MLDGRKNVGCSFSGYSFARAGRKGALLSVLILRVDTAPLGGIDPDTSCFDSERGGAAGNVLSNCCTALE